MSAPHEQSLRTTNPPIRANLRELFFCVFGEHFFGVDGDEDAFAAGEDFVFVVENFGGIDMGASAFFDFAAFDAQRFVQRNGLEIFDRHFTREGDYLVELVDLAHGVVEDAGDDAAVAVAGRSGVAGAEAEFADEGLALFIEDEFQAHAAAIALSADEAVILLQFVVSGFVALDAGLAWHGSDFSLPTISTVATHISQKRRDVGDPPDGS